MQEIHRIGRRREEITEEMLAIRSLLRGSITEQRVPSAKGERGPYYVLSRNDGGRTKSRRIRPGDDLEKARRDVAARARLKELYLEFEALTERLGELESSDPEVKKKRRK